MMRSCCKFENYDSETMKARLVPTCNLKIAPTLTGHAPDMCSSSRPHDRSGLMTSLFSYIAGSKHTRTLLSLLSCTPRLAFFLFLCRSKTTIGCLSGAAPTFFALYISGVVCANPSRTPRAGFKMSFFVDHFMSYRNVLFLLLLFSVMVLLLRP